MAVKRNEMVLSLALVLMITWHGVGAQSTCMNAVLTLTPCANYLAGGSLGPSTSCCSQFNSMIQNEPECICSFMNGGGAALGIVASQATTLALPGACSLNSPSLGQCNVASGPTAISVSPASAPMESQSPESTPSNNSNNDNPQTITPTAPSQATTPLSAGSGSKTVPSTNNTSSGATITESSFLVAILLLLAMSFDLSIVRF